MVVKKKFRLIKCFILTISIMLVNSIGADALVHNLNIIDVNSPHFQKSVMEAFREQYGENYKEILAKNIYATDIANKINLKFINLESGVTDYPIGFGGLYIDDDNDLIVQIVKNSNQGLDNSIMKITREFSDDLLYKYVDYSYQELEKVNNIIVNYFVNKKITNGYLVANYVDVINNLVIVELKNNSAKEKKWFKSNVINSPLIKFVQGDSMFKKTTTYSAGDNINNTCSLGYRVKRNGIQGFITAAHCYSLNQVINGYGNVTARVYDGYNGKDGEFVKLSSGNYVDNNIKWPTYPTTTISTSTNMYQTLVVGSAVAKSGYKTHATSGVITNLSTSLYDVNNNYEAKFVQTSAQCNDGDSGGVVYKPSLGGGIVLGIVHAKLCSDNQCINSGQMIFSRADWLDNALNLTRY